MAAPENTNSHQVESPEEFQSLLSADLNRVSLLYFWAPWAPPCKQMTEVVDELARKYPKLLSLHIEAETHSDIAESFDIESVPTFIVLRGHTLLDRIKGADASALTKAIAKHIGSASSNGVTTPPLSQTDKAPATGTTTTETETPEELELRLRGLMNQSKVVLFMKGSPDVPRCGFSRKICGLLGDQKIEFSHFDILTDESVRQGLKKLNDWPTFPQLIVKGELVGGLDIVQEMADSGELRELVA
ncbi:glutaredoxin [Lactarius pseudohatsudake]|nr:glutaredoxin [Lactarius pseudohatsudake]